MDTGSTPTTYQISRRTGDNRYTDKMDLAFTASGGGCQVKACSESQVCPSARVVRLAVNS